MKLTVWKVAFFSCCLLMFTPVFAQQIHFVYIQSDDKQPFSVAVNGKTYTASETGYVIVSRLSNGTWPMTISFPGQKYPDQQFTCIVDNADAGYALKNYGEKGWGLFNFQTLDILMAGAEPVTKKADSADSFGDMLSEVADDTTLHIDPPMPEVAAATAATVKEKEAVQANTQVDKTTGLAVNPVVAGAAVVAVPAADESVSQAKPVAAVFPAAFVKLTETTTAEGSTLVFLDTAGGGSDTVRVFIPRQPVTNAALPDSSTKAVAAAGAVVAVVPDAQQPPVAEVQPVTDAAGADAVKNPFYTKEQSQPPVVQPEKTVAKNTVDVAPAAAAAAVVAVPPKQECKKMLSAGDLDKIRHKMFLSSSDSKMTDAAMKGFNNKCVTVDQLKELGILYLSDEGRFNFFAASIPFVADPAALGSLNSQLVDPAYKQRLAGLIK